MKNIVLIGGGNQVQYTIDIVEKENKYKIVGIIDSIKEIGTQLYGYTIIGRQEDLNELINTYNIDGGIISIGDNWSRYYVYESIKKIKPDFQYVNAIHPSISIGNNVTLGVGIVAMAGCIINPGSVIGNFCFFATGAQIEHDCIIDDYASVSAGSVMGGHVKLGKLSAITLGVTVVDRISIGENTVIGAGSVVLKSLPDDVLVYGNPAKIIRNREKGEKFLK
jgi:sugar O-acyltransferase (sialic acid O-acetyltransferase NeuD family)